MGKNDAHLLTASAAIREIKSGRLSAQELMSACAAQIEKLEPKVRAWAYFNRDLALAQAREVDKRIREKQDPPAPLFGIPVGVKDIFNTADMPTQMGSPIWKNFTPGNDARSVFYVREAGGIIAGKTVTAEFAVHAPGETSNPHRLDRSPGTSSSGSAVAVACFMCPVSMGTQTAGSVVRPASYCGVYGYKPSFGLIPRTGMLKTTDSLDTIGYFARSVDDLELFLDAVRVKGPNYPFSDAALSDAARQDKGGGPWRVALVKGPKWKFAKDYAKDALKKYAAELSARGAAVEEVELPAEFERAHETHEIIYERTLAYYFKEEFKKRTLISDVIYGMIERGSRFTLKDYTDALARQDALAHSLDRFFGKYDVILTLSTDESAPEKKNPEEKPDTCLIWTMCGAPAMGMPVFMDPSGMPFGAQLVARRYNDTLLLKFAKFLNPPEVRAMPALS